LVLKQQNDELRKAGFAFVKPKPQPVMYSFWGTPLPPAPAPAPWAKSSLGKPKAKKTFSSAAPPPRPLFQQY
jgi:hypothetical protein